MRFMFWTRERGTTLPQPTDNWYVTIRSSVQRVLDELSYVARDVNADMTIVKNNIDELTDAVKNIKLEPVVIEPPKDNKLENELLACRLEIARLNSLLESNTRFIQDTLTKFVEKSVANIAVPPTDITPKVVYAPPQYNTCSQNVYTEEQIKQLPFAERKRLLGISQANGLAGKLP